MELTSRRFAIFLASGLSLAVIVGVLVWKVSDAGVNLSGQQTEIAGQPVAAADADERSTEKTAVSSEMSSTADHNRDENGEETANAGTGNGQNGDARSGGDYDPLAPRNANLAGARGGSEEIPYYRPTNAAPAPQNEQTAAPAQTQQPNNGGYAPAEQGETKRTTRTTVHPHTATAAPQQPEEPQRPSEGDADGTSPTNAEPQKASKEVETEGGAQLASEIAEKALDAGQAAVGTKSQDGNGPKRPEDPFSASTRVPHAPAENAGTENGAEAGN